jgi:hypothetical protein
LRDGEPLPDRVVSCDVPDDVSAYRGDLLFRRSRRILPASRRPPLQVGGYRWDTEGTLSRTRDALPLREEIRSYLRSEVPTVEIETADREEESHLRALGYLEPEASEAK